MRTIVCLMLLSLATTAMSDEKSPPLAELKPEQYESDEQAAATADELDKLYPAPRPEGVRMLTAILRGSMMGGDSGWFGPAQSRYSWQWLAEQQLKDAEANEIPQDKFQGEELLWK